MSMNKLHLGDYDTIVVNCLEESNRATSICLWDKYDAITVILAFNKYQSVLDSLQKLIFPCPSNGMFISNYFFVELLKLQKSRYFFKSLV